MLEVAMLLNPPPRRGRRKHATRRVARRHKPGCACVVCAWKRKKTIKVSSSARRRSRRKVSAAAVSTRVRPHRRRRTSSHRRAAMARRRVKLHRGRRKGRRYSANKRGWFGRKGRYRGAVSRRVGRRRRKVFTHPKRATVRARRRRSSRRRVFAANPPVRRSRRRRSSSRRRYARNGGSRRRRVSIGNPVTSIMSSIKDVVSVDAVKTAVAGLAGFGGALGIPQAVLSSTEAWKNPWIRVGASLLTTALLGVVVNYVTKDRELVKTAITGGLVATGWRGLSEAVPADKKASFPIPLLAGMGDAASDNFRRAIEQEIVQQLNQNGVSAYLTPGQADRAQVQMNGYRRNMGAYLTPGQVDRAQGFALSGMGRADEFDTKSIAERF